MICIKDKERIKRFRAAFKDSDMTDKEIINYLGFVPGSKFRAVYRREWTVFANKSKKGGDCMQKALFGVGASLASVALFASPAMAWDVDLGTVSGDVTTIGGIVLGISALILGYRIVKSMLSR